MLHFGAVVQGVEMELYALHCNSQWLNVQSLGFSPGDQANVSHVSPTDMTVTFVGESAAVGKLTTVTTEGDRAV
jgi:hypothetical protein